MTLEQKLGIKQGEHLAAVARSFAPTLIPVLLIVTFMAFFPFFYLLPLMEMGYEGYAIIVGTMLLCAIIGTRSFVKWHGSLLAVTDRRLIFVRQKGIFSREVQELNYDKITEVSFKVSGFSATIFGFGNMRVKSAASDEPIEMPRVHHPQKLHHLIIDLQAQAAGGPGNFGAMLQAVSHFDNGKLIQLRNEIEKTLKERV